MVTGGFENTAKAWQTAGAEQVVTWQEEEPVAERLLATRQLDWAAELERQRLALGDDDAKMYLNRRQIYRYAVGYVG